jgi:hypothetical protein
MRSKFTNGFIVECFIEWQNLTALPWSGGINEFDDGVEVVLKTMFVEFDYISVNFKDN